MNIYEDTDQTNTFVKTVDDSQLFPQKINSRTKVLITFFPYGCSLCAPLSFLIQFMLGNTAPSKCLQAPIIALVSLLRKAYIWVDVPAPCARIPVGCEVTWYRPTCAALHNSTLPTLYRAESLCVLFVFAELQDAVEEILPTLREQGISVYLLSDTCKIEGINTLSEKISRASDEPLSPQLRANIHIRSTALYIYTSGTTGTEGGA